jgi:hypothetical protein
MRKQAQDTTQIGPLPIGRRWSKGSKWTPKPLELLTLLGICNLQIHRTHAARKAEEYSDLGYFGTSIRLHFRSGGAAGSYQPTLSFHCVDDKLELVVYTPPVQGSWVIPRVNKCTSLYQASIVTSLEFEIQDLAVQHHGALMGTVVRHDRFLAGPITGVPNLVNVECAYWI